jgi:hypothetical protein
VDKLVAPIPILFEDMNFSLVKGGGGLVEWARAVMYPAGMRRGRVPI